MIFDVLMVTPPLLCSSFSSHNQLPIHSSYFS